MALIICSECGKEFSDKASTCPHCGCPTEEAKKKQMPDTKSSVKSKKTTAAKLQKKEVLRDYLESARTLETDLYTYDKILEELPKQKITISEKPNSISAPSKPTQVVKPRVKKETVDFLLQISSFAILLGLGGWLFFGIGAILFKQEGVLCTVLGYVGLISLVATPVLFIWSIITKKREQAYNTYRNQMYRYENALIQYQNNQKEIKEYDEQFPKSVAFNKSIEKAISETKENREKANLALSRLYDQNVIHPKYRGIIPVTMFCEYMDTSRRTLLTGENGMYDLYEAELLGKQIVGELQAINVNLKELGNKIDRISSQLVGIQRNQILLYEEVARGNSISAKICSEISGQKDSLNAMRSSLSEIQNSAELTAFNSKAIQNSVEVMNKLATDTYAELHY